MTTGFYPQVAVQKTGVAVTGVPGALYNVTGGRIMLWSLFGVVTTVIGGVATTLRIDANPTTGTDTALCAASATIAAAPVGSLFGITGTASDAMALVTASQGALLNMATPLIIQPGSIDLVVVAGGTTGALTWRAMWDQIDEGAVLAAA